MARNITGRKRISPEEANESELACKRGHIGCWDYQENRRGFQRKPTRRCYQCSLDKARRTIYGITPEAFAQLKVDNPCCGICGGDGKDCGMGILEIDHDHNTGEIRGLLCRKCNIFLGHYESRRHLMDAVEGYLNRGR